MTQALAEYNTARGWIEDAAFRRSLATVTALDPDRMARIVLNQFRKNPKLCACSRASILLSLMRAAEVNLEPDGRRASLVPFKTECQLIIGYPGYVELAYRHPRILSVQAQIVYVEDEFRLALGTSASIHHVPADQRTEVRGAYAVAIVCSDDKATSVPVPEWMTVDEIDAIRRAAPGYNARDGAHQRHPNEMRRKTVLRRLCKYLPHTPEMSKALSFDEAPSDEPAEPLDLDGIEQALTAPSGPGAEEPADEQ